MTVVPASIKRGGILLPLAPSGGVSSDALTLESIISGTWRRLADSIAVRCTAESAIAELRRVQAVTSTRNWDGYGALPLDARAVDQAVRFFRALPTTAPVPEVSADPDGEVELMWHVDAKKTFSVSVGPSGRLTYAALLGDAQSYGTEWLSNEIPQSILNNLSRVLDGNS